MLTPGGSTWHEQLHKACTVSDAGLCVGVDGSLCGRLCPGRDEHPHNAYEDSHVRGGVITGDAAVELHLRIRMEPSLLAAKG
jgi:hypothetical protein